MQSDGQRQCGTGYQAPRNEGTMPWQTRQQHYAEPEQIFWEQSSSTAIRSQAPSQQRRS